MTLSVTEGDSKVVKKRVERVALTGDPVELLLYQWPARGRALLYRLLTDARVLRKTVSYEAPRR